MTDYLMNCWYAAAWAEEVTPAPLARTYLDLPVMLYRRADGVVAALLDRCPHRFAPLSRGRIEHDRVICGYHGLTFDSGGTCIDTRFNAIVRDNARLRSFPVVERHRTIWIWMGDAGRADPALIPDFGFFDDTERVSVHGYTHVKSHYLLEVDNLMDLSHIDFVHGNTISGGVMADARHEVRQEGTTVHSDTLCASVPCLPNFEPKIQANGRPTDHWLDMRWDAPGNMLLDLGVTLADRPREEGHRIMQGHFLTPETAGTTHYFWGLSRPDQGEPADFDVFLKELTRKAFEDEDLPMIEAVQRRMRGDDFWALRPVIFPEDAGAIRARRALQNLIATERAAA
jgi:vanillate O-demethylase monooxygenase subunit